ncbi:hypothetical protein AB1N83_002619 [Pleurotus pulmonarius]
MRRSGRRSMSTCNVPSQRALAYAFARRPGVAISMFVTICAPVGGVPVVPLSPVEPGARDLENFLIKHCVIIEEDTIILFGDSVPLFDRHYLSATKSIVLGTALRYSTFDCWLNLYLRHGVAFLIFRPVIRPSGVWHEYNDQLNFNGVDELKHNDPDD